MRSKARHRYSQKEMDAVYSTLTEDEQDEYNGLSWGGFTANTLRLRELENLGFARLRKDKDEV